MGNRCCIHRPRHQQRLIVLLREELLHDIQFEAWKISKTHIDNVTLQSNLHVNDDADDWIERKIEQAIDKIYDKMSFALVDRSAVLTDRLDDIPLCNIDEAPRQDGQDIKGLFARPIKYEFLFSLDQNWRGSTRAIRGYLHLGIVDYVLAEWFSLVLPDKEQEYIIKSERSITSAASNCRTAFVNVTFKL